MAEVIQVPAHDERDWSKVESLMRKEMAEAEAPARPVPTTMTSNFLLLAGLTSLSSNRCLSHFVSSEPPGTAEFNCIVNLLTFSPDKLGERGPGDVRTNIEFRTRNVEL